ncbi:MAG: nuclear transport factor 2 family protein [bacterium]|nr:hypothetical protein [Deltaproteobacteria bacterium]MCP4905485.1 nuclear transport factor 2 family protein [bacterium]
MPTEMQEAEKIARNYFDRVRGRDPGVADLFHEDGSIIGLGGVKSGRETIRDFYKASIEAASPTPALIGEVLVNGSRAVAEIKIALADGSGIHAMDLFIVEDGLIRSLTYFIADH